MKMKFLVISIFVTIVIIFNLTNGQKAGKKDKAQGRPKPVRKMSPRSAMTSYCTMSDSDPSDGEDMKERLVDYISCKESVMVSCNW